MWMKDLPDGYESRKCRYRVASLCRGVGLDLNVRDEKIVPTALGICKVRNPKADLVLDVSANDGLGLFSDNQFDYIFDAHQLGDFGNTEAILKEWWRVVKPGGFIILYEQDKDYYPLVDTPGADPLRRTDLYWEDAWSILESFGNAELFSSSRHNESNEYSWQLVVRKKFATTTKPQETLTNRDLDGRACLPRTKKTDKEALVIRYGALGDTVWVTPVLSQLKKDGYYVVMNCTEKAAQVLKNNPNIDEYIIHHEYKDIPYEELECYWHMMGRNFEKVINLTKSCEGHLIKVEGSKEFRWSKERRHAECNYNFQDRVMEMAGYPDKKGLLPELYFSDIEESLAQTFVNAHKDKFVIVWSMSGSGFHKTYPWAEYVAGELAMQFGDIEIITVGDDDCKILEWQNPKTINKCGVYTVRQSFLLTKYADLVVGADTGLLNAASAFDTPKIVFLSTNTEENLTKYWQNTTALHNDDCECYPCHKLIYTNTCPKGRFNTAPKCMEGIEPKEVLDAILVYYQQWKDKQLENRNKQKWCAFTIADSELTHRLADRVQESFKLYHPAIPFFKFDTRDEESILGETKESAQACKAFEIRPRFMRKLLDDYDGVIYLDADTVVCDRLDEFLTGDYDVAGSLNIGDQPYLNAGVSACMSKKFCDDWTHLMYKPEAGKSNQTYFNQLANSQQYKLKIVDVEKVYYNERSRPYWKNLKVCSDNRLRTHGRVVKVLHWAGGVGKMEDKLSSSDFSQEVREHLNKLTNTTDFTDIDGVEVSSWGIE
jgi:ADP-heptose:LPS heptosyltransferase